MLYDGVRLNASVMAVNNCKRKAGQLAQAVGVKLGPVVAIREDPILQSNDVTSPVSEASSGQSRAVLVQEQLHKATLRITANVSVTFQLRCHRH